YNILFDDEQKNYNYELAKITEKIKYISIEQSSFDGIQNDIGYNTDAGDRIQSSIPIYAGEPINENIPGRGRSGTLEPSNKDTDDWYRFSACEGQNIQASITSDQDYDCEIWNSVGTPVGISYTVEATGWQFIQVYAKENSGDGEYQMSITISGQNDAETGVDSGDNINQVTKIEGGKYSGYLDHNDHEDWYSFDVNVGDGIFVRVEPMEKSDYDIHLYNPDDILVHSEQFYDEDNLEYPSDISGTWKIKIDIFPGWDLNKWPDNYFLYGSGVYELELSIGGDANPPIITKSQPEIIPIAQTFIVDNDPSTSKDEYSYLAAVPAANYVENGKRYVSPIVYQGIDIVPNWFTSIDETTQYLLDD
ncbi:unnamed protein product, partial [marine sediment metagenome]